MASKGDRWPEQASSHLEHSAVSRARVAKHLKRAGQKMPTNTLSVHIIRRINFEIVSMWDLKSH